MKRIVIATLCLSAGTAPTVEITVISGGRVEPSLQAFIQLIRRDPGQCRIS